MNKKFFNFSTEKYIGCSNENITKLKNDLSQALILVQLIDNNILKIQNDCIHTYMLSEQNCYICSKCDHVTWK